MNRFDFEEVNHFPSFRAQLQKYTGPTMWFCSNCHYKLMDKKGRWIKIRCNLCGTWMQHQRWNHGKERVKTT